MDTLDSFVYQCCLLITLANSLEPDQAQRIFGPDQGPNCDIPILFLKEFLQKVNFEKNQQMIKCMKNYPACNELRRFYDEVQAWSVSWNFRIFLQLLLCVA